MAKAKKPRGFHEVIVGNCVSQQGSDRYAEPWEELESERLLNPVDEDGPQFLPPAEGTFCEGGPTIAPWRSNLVALSQRFNLYFAAYRAQVHITMPRNVKQTLPPHSDMIMLPPRSEKARKTAGYIDPSHPHCVNHLMIGNLGDHEILLIGCDDGDVFAYYTHLIMQDFEPVEAGVFNRITPFCLAYPFFHENVGISAWGLAIHEKSRLIAVGSNLREVTVFVFALDDHNEGLDNAFEETACSDSELFPTITSTKKNKDGSVDRTHSFRKILSLGPQGHNIPSITFASNEGEAEYVIAIDILGNLWLLGIWDSTINKHVPSLYKNQRQEQRPLGWGVFVLPLNYFKKVPTVQLALGTSRSPDDIVADASRNSCLDISDTVDAVKDASVWHPEWYYDIFGPPRTEGLSSLEDLIEVTAEVIGADSNTGLVPEEDYDSSEDNSIVTSTEKELKGNAEKTPDMTLLKTMSYWQELFPDSSTLLPDDCAILRTYKSDIELQPSSLLMTRTVCKQVVKQTIPADVDFPLQHVDRLNMLASIPELSLVVIASQAGRAALISLTQVDVQGPVVMFRLDLVLPFKSQEDEFLRPVLPLLGIAVSPLPLDMTRKRGGWGMKRWRLIMHYYDHTILSYELSRHKETNGLVVD